MFNVAVSCTDCMLTDLQWQTLLECAAHIWTFRGETWTKTFQLKRLLLVKVLVIDHAFPPEPVLPNTGNEAAAAVAIYVKSFCPNGGSENVGDGRGSSGIQSMTWVHGKLINTANPLDLFQLTVPARTTWDTQLTKASGRVNAPSPLPTPSSTSPLFHYQQALDVSHIQQLTYVL